MINKIYNFLCNNGLAIMVAGFLTSVVSFLVFFQTRFHGTATPRIAIGCTIAGFVIYVVGRIFVATARQRNRKMNKTNTATDKDDG